MEYELRHFDRTLLRFEADKGSVDPGYRILWIDNSAVSLLPMGFEPTERGLESWVRHRAIPKNRAFVSTFLARSGLSANRPLDIIAVCKGLSLNDCYWVAEAGSEDSFGKVNLYENPMSRLLAQIAFTGHGSSPRAGFNSSPEFTTNGNLPKCWRRIDGKVYLYKGGTTGAANAGFEPYSEFYASEVARAFGVNAVAYTLHRWKGTLCSSCELFTSLERSFVPAASVVSEGGFAAVAEHYAGLGGEYVQALSDMVAFDALICNTDRHFNNFGFLVDSRSNELVSPAPLFDHGNSLFYQGYGDDWLDDEHLDSYASALMPCAYDDFFDTARELMTHETRGKVRGLLEFEFRAKPRYRLPRERLALIERQIRKRAQMLLE